MQIGSEAFTIEDQGWTVRIQPPKAATGPHRVLLALHGWTGNETVMWIFTRNLPQNLWIFAPRGPYKSEEGGYGWLGNHGIWPKLSQFSNVSSALINAFHTWKADVHAPQDPFDVMGFSQGAAMSYALTAYYPQAVSRVISLAGFLPRDDTDSNRYLTAYKNRKVYVAHGSADETVPVKMAQEAVVTLQAAGAQVTYCESEVGHKLSADCLRGLEKFFT